VTRFVVHADAVLELAELEFTSHPDHQLVAPTLVRSQTLSALYQAVRRGELTQPEAKRRLDVITTMPMRLLGDRVLKSKAWQIATDLGWPDTYDAEYVALTQLQADAFITTSNDLAAAVQGLVTTAPLSVLLNP
jgi:predicted nucleic acid-binding protein